MSAFHEDHFKEAANAALCASDWKYNDLKWHAPNCVIVQPHKKNRWTGGADLILNLARILQPKHHIKTAQTSF